MSQDKMLNEMLGFSDQSAQWNNSSATNQQFNATWSTSHSNASTNAVGVNLIQPAQSGPTYIQLQNGIAPQNGISYHQHGDRSNGNKFYDQNVYAPSCSYNTADHTIPIYSQQQQNYYDCFETAPSGAVSKQKRIRTAFTTSQMTALEREYMNNRYLERSRRSQLAQFLSLTEKTVKVWFQNRRMKMKKDKKLFTSQNIVSENVAQTSNVASPNVANSQPVYQQVQHQGGFNNAIPAPVLQSNAQYYLGNQYQAGMGNATVNETAGYDFQNGAVMQKRIFNCEPTPIVSAPNESLQAIPAENNDLSDDVDMAWIHSLVFGDL